MSSALPQDNHLLDTSLSPEKEDSEFQNTEGSMCECQITGSA